MRPGSSQRCELSLRCFIESNFPILMLAFVEVVLFTVCVGINSNKQLALYDKAAINAYLDCSGQADYGCN